MVRGIILLRLCDANEHLHRTHQAEGELRMAGEQVVLGLLELTSLLLAEDLFFNSWCICFSSYASLADYH